MRVLLVGPHWDTGQWTEYCAEGLRDAGHDVRMHRYSQRLERPIGLWGRVQRRLKGPDRFNVARVFDAMQMDNLDVIRLAARHRPEFTLVLKGEVLLPETIERLRNLTSGPVVQWCGDDPGWFPNITAAAHLYDRFYLADPTYAPDLEPRGVTARFMPHAVHPAAWTGQDADAEPVDVIFVGDARHNMGHLPASRSRVEILEAVARSGANLAVWGRGWEKLEPGYRVREAHRGLTLLPETIERLRNLTSGPVVQWCGDDPGWFPNITAAAHLYDRFYLADPTYAPDLEPRGVTARFMPHAVHPAAWTGQDADAEPVDVIFVGDARHNMGHLPASRSRVEILEAVARSGANLAVWGRGWEKLEPGYRVREAHRGLTLLPAAAVARAYRSAKIVLNIHHAQMREGPNMRTFEIPAAGAFQLTDFKARMPELFEVGTELATYQDADDAAASIERYLNDESARRAIAEAGKRRVERDHTYAVRMRQLIDDSLDG